MVGIHSLISMDSERIFNSERTPQEWPLARLPVPAEILWTSWERSRVTVRPEVKYQLARNRPSGK